MSVDGAEAEIDEEFGGRLDWHGKKTSNHWDLGRKWGRREKDLTRSQGMTKQKGSSFGLGGQGTAEFGCGGQQMARQDAMGTLDGWTTIRRLKNRNWDWKSEEMRTGM